MFHTSKCVLALAVLNTLISFASSARADLFIADGDRIGKYSDAGAVINADFIELSSVTGLALGSDGYLYAGSTTGGTASAAAIFRYNPATGAQIGATPFIDYTNIAVSPSNPQGMHFGPCGNLYIADETLSKFYVFGPAGNFIATRTSANPDIVDPTGLTADANHVYVVCGQGIARYNAITDDFTNLVPPGIQNNPHDAAFGPDGFLYVLDVSSSPGVLRFNAATGAEDFSFHINLDDLITSDNIVYFPSNINFGPDGRLDISGFDANTAAGSVIQYDLAGNFQGFLIPSTSTLTFSDSFFLFTTVPEPTTLALVLPAALCLIRRRKNR